jgi:hypothetical protein
MESRAKIGLFLCPIVFAACIAACRQTPPAPALPELTFAHLASVPLKVSDIVLRDAYIPSLAPPQVEHLHSLTPSGAIRRWHGQRFRAASATGQLEFLLEEAGVIEERFKTRQGIGGWFRDETDSLYICRLTLRIIYSGPVMPAYAVRTVVEVKNSVPESANVNERELAYLETIELAIGNLDAEVIAILRRDFAPLLADQAQ